MSFFDHKDFDNHEQVCYFSDEASGFKAIVAIHNTQLGASLGGTRFYNYANDDDAAKVNLHIEGIYDTLTEMFERSAKENRPTSELADTIARERLNQGIPTLA